MSDELVGHWKVVSLSQEDYTSAGQTRAVVIPVRGEALFTAEEGREVIAVMPERCGTAAPDEAAPAPILQSGRYRVSGDKLIEQIELALRSSVRQ